MSVSVHWSWFAVLSCLLLMGCGVRGDCTEENMEMEGGTYDLTKELQVGSSLVYRCPEGYHPYPALVRVCQLNHVWNPQPKPALPQRCKMVECPDPTVLTNGDVSPIQDRYFVDNETTFECYAGYTMRGSRNRVCLPNGKWSGTTTICSRDSRNVCADPGIPPGASRTGNMFGIDDVVTYTCNSNLFLVGPAERRCQESGEWTGKEPACYYKHTFDTAQEVAQAFGSAIEHTLVEMEPIDHTLEGRTIRLTKNGTLNIFIAVDVSESIEKTDFKNAKEAVTKLLTKISSFTVTPNYEIVFFSAEMFEVVNILDFMDGRVQLNEALGRVKNFTVGDRNTLGTDLSIVFKNFEEKISLIKRRAGEEAFKEHHHVIIVFTDGAFNMGGSPAPYVQRIKNLVYMTDNRQQEKVAREEFLDIYIFGVGVEVLSAELQPLTVGTGGKHYFRLTNTETLNEMFDEMIDEDDVKGLCGLHKDFDTLTKDNLRRRYPWWVYIVVQNEGTRRCLGSLVSSKFVLTAAHCFIFGDTPRHVTVEIDDGQGRVKRVKTFYLHPKYNISAKVDEGVKEFYDFDVALIQLENEVQLSTTVRRICIPGTQETSDALGLLGASTLRDQEEKVLRSHLEQFSFLTKKGNSISEKVVHAKLGDNRVNCIKHAIAATGVTTDDPTIPVTTNFLCTGGRQPYRDDIACQGDSGGALFKIHSYRMVQVGVVSWGTKNLCSSGGPMQSDDVSRDFHINLFKMVDFLQSVLSNDDQDDFVPLEFLPN